MMDTLEPLLHPDIGSSFNSHRLGNEVPKKRHSIMLSSTYKELKEHRAAVSEAALGQGMFPLDMAMIWHYLIKI